MVVLEETLESRWRRPFSMRMQPRRVPRTMEAETRAIEEVSPLAQGHNQPPTRDLNNQEFSELARLREDLRNQGLVRDRNHPSIRDWDDPEFQELARQPAVDLPYNPQSREYLRDRGLIPHPAGLISRPPWSDMNRGI